jgi:hypothetical protein
MKTFLILFLVAGLGHCSQSRAQECKVTTVTQESNGRVQSESTTLCKEGEPVPTKVVKGQVILEHDVNKVSSSPNYFKYKNSKCRMFENRYIENSIIRVDHGVICQADNDGVYWMVLDRW